MTDGRTIGPGVDSDTSELDTDSLELRSTIALPAEGSISHRAWETEKHLHPTNGSEIYPIAVSGVAITSAGGVATYGNWIEVVPVNTITKKFDPNVIYVSEVSFANALYRLEFAKGLAGFEVCIGSILAAKNLTTKDVARFALNSPRVDANERISARCMDSAGGKNLTIFMGYHRYMADGLQ